MVCPPGLGPALGQVFQGQNCSLVHSRPPCSLRAPKAPDVTADMGRHEFTYALMPHAGECCLAPSLLFSKPRFLQLLVGRGKQLPCTSAPFFRTHSFLALAQALSRMLVLSKQPTASTSPCWRCPPQAGLLCPPGVPHCVLPCRGAGDRQEGTARGGVGWGGAWAASTLAPPTIPFPLQAETNPQGRTLVLRLYEAHGSHVDCWLHTSLPVQEAVL